MLSVVAAIAAPLNRAAAEAAAMRSTDWNMSFLHWYRDSRVVAARPCDARPRRGCGHPGHWLEGQSYAILGHRTSCSGCVAQEWPMDGRLKASGSDSSTSQWLTCVARVGVLRASGRHPLLRRAPHRDTALPSVAPERTR